MRESQMDWLKVRKSKIRRSQALRSGDLRMVIPLLRRGAVLRQQNGGVVALPFSQ